MVANNERSSFSKSLFQPLISHDLESKFYNSLLQKCLDDENTLIYSTHNEGKAVIAKKFIKP